jgi:ATP-dependent metalloprotease
MSIEDVRKLH